MSLSSNNTNKLSPQELTGSSSCSCLGSNNTNKLSPQEPYRQHLKHLHRSNNTNKLSPQEQGSLQSAEHDVQIIQINLVLKNSSTINH